MEPGQLDNSWHLIARLVSTRRETGRCQEASLQARRLQPRRSVQDKGYPLPSE